MSQYAVIKDGVVTNIIEWDGVTEFGLSDDEIAIEYTKDNPAAIGCLYDSDTGLFSPPPLTDEEQQQQEEQQQATMLAFNIAKKKELLSEASEQISILQDAVDESEATDSEVSMLSAWKKYRITLNRIDANTSSEIDWPIKPE